MKRESYSARALAVAAALMLCLGALAAFAIPAETTPPDTAPHASTQLELLHPDGSTTVIQPIPGGTGEDTVELHALQLMLEEAIRQLDGVEEASVTTATGPDGKMQVSVLVVPEGGGTLHLELAEEVRALITAAVQNVREEDISIASPEGTVYHSGQVGLPVHDHIYIYDTDTGYTYKMRNVTPDDVVKIFPGDRYLVLEEAQQPLDGYIEVYVPEQQSFDDQGELGSEVFTDYVIVDADPDAIIGEITEG